MTLADGLFVSEELLENIGNGNAEGTNWRVFIGKFNREDYKVLTISIINISNCIRSLAFSF